jgi:ferritin-like metal-binding protein YciE
MKKENSKPSQGQSKKSTGATAPVQAKSDAAKLLQELFEDELKDIYWAEKALTKAIPKMIKNASSSELKDALQEHLTVTEGQVRRLDEVFAAIEKKPQAKKCEAMEGLLKEAESIMEGTQTGVVRDAGIISAAQKVEHYEIASYGTLCSFANTLGLDDAADLLKETLNEEKEADELLTKIAESSINIEALSGDSRGAKKNGRK